MEPIYERVEGQYGTAEPIEIPAIASAVETICHWLLTAPIYHPFWSQYLLYAVRLTDDLPGFPEPHHQFEGTTHEVGVIVLNPEEGRQTPDTMSQHSIDGTAPFLHPVNICEQFIATDDEIRRLVSLCAQAVVHGLLNPDTDGRAGWLPAMTKTLAHFRSEPHAS